jgi:hypothetical protein
MCVIPAPTGSSPGPDPPPAVALKSRSIKLDSREADPSRAASDHRRAGALQAYGGQPQKQARKGLQAANAAAATLPTPAQLRAAIIRRTWASISSRLQGPA